uniref:Si:dkeyp-97b10.3 n=1 Tax=Myripristis murdjan TaxID=586833 RepID=A0A667YE67_9TELE
MVMSRLPPGGSPRDVYSEYLQPRSFCALIWSALIQIDSLSIIFVIMIVCVRVCVCVRVQLEGEGTFECSVTGLVFEVSEPVLIRYSVLSWSKFGMFLRDSWKFAGPIFNVDTVNKDASVLKSIQFPHSLCLADPDNEMTFSVLHIKNNRPVIEPTADHSGSHVKWCVSSLSPVGPIVQTSQSVEHHGVVLVYKMLGNNDDNSSYSFRIYLATNNSSDIKDIAKELRTSKRRYMKIEKPPTCKLYERSYRLLSEPEGEIGPEDLTFTLAVTKLKGYFEALFEQPPPFKLSLIETDTDQIVWSATIREGDCLDNTVEKPRKRTDSRKRSSSASEEETASKRARWQDESDGVKTVLSPGQDITEKQLLQVAKRLGKEWKQVAIYLDLTSRDLEDIQATEKDVTMQKLKMLVEWKNRKQQGEATALNLCKSLEDLEDLPNEVYQILKDMTTTH